MPTWSHNSIEMVPMKHLNVRLSDEIHAALTALAEADRRSLNSMVIVLIEAERKRRAESE